MMLRYITYITYITYIIWCMSLMYDTSKSDVWCMTWCFIFRKMMYEFDVDVWFSKKWCMSLMLMFEFLKSDVCDVPSKKHEWRNITKWCMTEHHRYIIFPFVFFFSHRLCIMWKRKLWNLHVMRNTYKQYRVPF